MEKRLIINIGASSDSFGAYAENCTGINIAGNSIKEIKEQLPEVINLYKEVNPETEWEEPIRENWPVEWKYDVQTLLNYYSGIITNAALQRLTGINQKQLWNYAHGISKPRKAAKEKIETALHKLGQELLELSL